MLWTRKELWDQEWDQEHSVTVVALLQHGREVLRAIALTWVHVCAFAVFDQLHITCNYTTVHRAHVNDTVLRTHRSYA
jgi:hypothetical protein